MQIEVNGESLETSVVYLWRARNLFSISHYQHHKSYVYRGSISHYENSIIIGTAFKKLTLRK